MAESESDRKGSSGTASLPNTIDDWARAPGGKGVRRVQRAIRSKTPFLFVTGPAGTGKSTLLKLVAKELGGPPVLAPTGVAARLIGGQTIHSFFRVGRGVQWRGDDKTQRPEELYRGMSTLIIDEVSMVRADLLDKVDWILRRARQSEEPFGGVRVIAFGDLLQLPPVVGRDKPVLDEIGYQGPHFFDAFAAAKVGIEIQELKTVYRQRDRAFVKVLHGVRSGEPSSDLLKRLNRRVFSDGIAHRAGSLTLTTRRMDAELVNEQELNALAAPQHLYTGRVEGSYPNGDLPVPPELRLSPGARVMWVKNDPDGRWVNGTLGVVRDCRPDSVSVEPLDGGATFNVHVVQWEKCRYDFDPKAREVKRRVVGRYTQLPLRLGWATTIHKAQGLSLERVHVDLGRGAFAPGQTYVALSRSRTEGGLTLERPIRRSDLIVDPQVLEFLNREEQDAAA